MRLNVADSKTKCTPVCTVVAIGRQVIQCFDGDTHLHRCASTPGVQHMCNAQGPRKRCRECIQSANGDNTAYLSQQGTEDAVSAQPA